MLCSNVITSAFSSGSSAEIGSGRRSSAVFGRVLQQALGEDCIEHLDHTALGRMLGEQAAGVVFESVEPQQL
jgi:hypothetical protein